MRQPNAQQAVLLEPGRIELRPATVPDIVPDSVDLEPLYVALCGTDLGCFRGANPLLRMPVVLGHEFCARVVACGSEVTAVTVGEVVAVAPLIACGECSFCASGREHLCARRVIFGVGVDGALRECLTMPVRTLFPLSGRIPWRESALTEPLAVAIHAVRRVSVRDQRVLIAGAGAIGLLIAQVARQMGAVSMCLSDVSEARRALARSMGFDAVRPDELSPNGADCVFVATDAPAALRAVPYLTDFGGTAVVVGLLHEAPLDWFGLLMKEATIATSRYFTLADFQLGIELLAARQVDVSGLIQDEAAFDDLADQHGEAVMERARRVVRLVIKMPAAN